MRFIHIFTFVFLISFTSVTQINGTYWGIEDTNLTISKTTDFGTVHDYLELFNYSGQDLEMRWIAYFSSNWPSLWIASFNDPTNWYQSVVDLDSSDFIINDPIGFQNKLVIGVAHYSQAGSGTINFKVFPVDHPEDFLILHYRTGITQGNAYASQEDLEAKNQIKIYKTNQDNIQISNIKSQTNVRIYSLRGSIVYSASTNTSKLNIELSNFESGIYVVRCLQADGSTVSKKIVL